MVVYMRHCSVRPDMIRLYMHGEKDWNLLKSADYYMNEKDRRIEPMLR